MTRWLALAMLTVLLLGGGLPRRAAAAAYSFPGALPGGCSGSNGNYSCAGLTLAYGDTVTIGSPKPATITINGNLSTDTSSINASGTANDLNLFVTGTLTLGYQARIKGNVSAASVVDNGGGQVAITGNLTATSGNLALAYQSSVIGNLSVNGSGTLTTGQAGTISGSISAGSGAVTIGDSGSVSGSIQSSGPVTVGQAATVFGNISAGSGAVQLNYQAQLRGTLTTTGTVTLAQSARVNGAIAGGSGNVSIGFAATVAGTLTTSTGTIDFAQSAAANACVRSTAGASITLGYQSTVNSVCCGVSCTSSCVANNSTYATPPLCTGGTSLLADYRMDETTAWSGIAGEVKDSSSNAYNAKAAAAAAASGKATTDSDSPAYGNSTKGTCGYGLFNRTSNPSATHAYVQLPAGFPALTGSFTVLGWIRSTDPSQSGQRIIVNDDNQDGWALSLGDQTSGSLRLFNRNLAPSGSVTTSGSNGAGATTANCGLLCLDSAPVIAANTWYYVAAVVDTANKQVQTLIYNAAGTLLASATTGFTGTWAVGSGGTTIGGESINSGEGTSSAFHFSGNIDELQVYNGLLNASDIAAQLTRTRACPAITVASFTISGTGSASTCSPQTLTITARDASGNILTGYTGTVALSTSSGRGDWSPGSGPVPSGSFSAGAANSGAATYTFAAGDAGIVKLRLAHSLAQSVNVTVVDTSVAASSSTSAAVTFSNNAFVWAEDLADKIAGSNIAVAGRNHDLQVSLVKKDPSTGSCGVATDFAGNRSLKLWRTDNGGPWTAPSIVSPALSVPASRPASNNLSLNFAAGVASLGLATTDIGKYSLNLDDDSLSYASSTVSGSTGDLTVRPFAIAVSGLTLSGNANAGGSTATDAVFGKAGAPFSATVAAYRYSAAADNGAGQPSATATLAQVSAGGLAPGYNTAVSLTPLANSQTPAAPGVLGALSNNVVSGFAGGTVTVGNLAYSEAGSFQLNTTAVVGSYLGTAGLNLDAYVFKAGGTQSNVVGRFIPAGFALSATSVVHRSDLACSPSSSFSYLDERFQLAYTLTAQNAAGATTRNYIGNFAKLDLTAAASINLAGIAGATSFKNGSGLVLVGSTGSWVSGVSSAATLTAKASRAATPVGPFDTAQFGIAPLDSDGVGMLALNLDTDSPANGADSALVGTIPLRYGRLKLQNAIGAANRPLNLLIAAQYWNGSAYTANTLDSCTRISASNLSFGNLRKSLTAADLVMSNSPVRVDPTKPTFITLAAPGGGRVGSVDLAVALGATAADSSCLKTAAAWVPTTAATAGANVAALRGAWCGSAATSDPAARATWGLYRGADGVVFQRENY
jgi:predicted acyltransferase (DUF342 family)